MLADLTGTYSLDSIKNVSEPPPIPPDWKWKAIYNKLRGRPPAVLSLEQGPEIPGRERYALLGTLKTGKSEFTLEWHPANERTDRSAVRRVRIRQQEDGTLAVERRRSHGGERLYQYS